MKIDYLSESFCHQSETHESVREWRSFYPKLETACFSGDFDLAIELIKSHPDRWKELDNDSSGFLAHLMDHVLLGRPKDFDQLEMQSGKKQLFYLLVSHENWRPDNLEDLLFPLLNPKNFSFDRDESFELICAFFQVDSLEEISIGMLADLSKALLGFEPCGYVRDMFQAVTSLPNWKKIPSYAYDKILNRIHFPYRTVEELEILFSHPNANRLKNMEDHLPPDSDFSEKGLDRIHSQRNW